MNVPRFNRLKGWNKIKKEIQMTFVYNFKFKENEQVWHVSKDEDENIKSEAFAKVRGMYIGDKENMYTLEFNGDEGPDANEMKYRLGVQLTYQLDVPESELNKVNQITGEIISE